MYTVQNSDRGSIAVEERGPPIFQPAEEIDLKELLRKLGRQKWVILGTIFTVMILTALVLTQVTPRYTAVNQIDISPRRSNVVDIETVIAGLPIDSATIETEMLILRSRNLAAKTVERLMLNRNPEFNPALRPASRLATLLEEVPSYLSQMETDSGVPVGHRLRAAACGRAEDPRQAGGCHSK